MTEIAEMMVLKIFEGKMKHKKLEIIKTTNAINKSPPKIVKSVVVLKA
jgi:hypothetical protein